MTIEDNLTEEDEEEELLLPKSSKSWNEVETTLHADTSPDSNVEGPAVSYEGFNHTNKLMTTKLTTEKS